MSSAAPESPLILAIDQGTTNSKAALVAADGRVVAVGSAPLRIEAPRSGWFEQDALLVWESVRTAVEHCVRAAPSSEQIVGVAIANQRESVLAWEAGTGRPIGPVIGWQDRRTAQWCAESVSRDARAAVRRRTGLRVDPMFSAPKLRWLLDRLPESVMPDDVRVGTIDSWLIWQLTGGAEHLTEAGNASRTLLYDVTRLDWSSELLEIFGVPPDVLPAVLPSVADFGVCTGLPGVPDGTPIVAVLADSHAALYGHGCTEVGMAKATYGTGSSVMTPVAGLPAEDSTVPTTLAWLIDGVPTYALEGNILYSGATLVWAAEQLTAGDVGVLVELAGEVADSGGVTLVPAFAGLGAPHWDREAQAMISGMTPGTGPAQLARAALDAVAHQICDIVDVIEATTGPLATFRADGGATAAQLLMQTQADLAGRPIEVAEVAEVSALGAARLGWRHLGRGEQWQPPGPARTCRPAMEADERRHLRRHWAGEVARARYVPDGQEAVHSR